MKALFVFGGLPHYYNKVLNKLNSIDGYEICVVVPSSKSKTIGSGVHETDENVRFSLIRLEEYKTWYGKPFFKGLYELINAEKPDYLVIGWPYYLSFVFNPLKLRQIKRRGVKILAKEIPFSIPAYNESFNAFNERSVASQKSDLIFRSRIWYTLMRWLRKRLYANICDGAVVYTEAGIDILSSYGMSQNKITVTYNSPDTEDIFDTIEKVRSNIHPLRKPNRILHVGRLVEWKRVDHLIKAVNLLSEKYPDIELVIVGKGEEEQNLKQLVNSLEMAKRVQFLGAVYDEAALSAIFLQADVYVLAGMGGLSINEAMCHELPVVCSVCDGTEKHLIFEGINGRYFEPDNIGSLASAIDSVLADPVMKQRMGEASLDIVRNKININTVIQGYQKAFQ